MLHTLALLLFLFTTEMDPKMRLDLSISENILTELLKQNGAPTTFVKGSYIPGYGVMLELSYRHLAVRALGTQVVGVDIDALIKRYLNDYGDLITGIAPDESISVSYSSRMSAKRSILSVKKRDVSDRRSGKITEAEFANRIRSQQVGSTSDAEIFAKVVETAVNADTSRVFSLRNVTASTLPGYGLLVSGTLSGGAIGAAPSVAFSFTTDAGAEMDLARAMAPEDIESIEVVRGQPNVRVARVSGTDSLNVLMKDVEEEVRTNLDGLRGEIVTLRNNVNRIEVQRRRSKEELATAYVTLEAQLKSVLLDYGRTLSSLEAGQTLMVRITNSRPSEGTPNSITFTVPKQVLTDYDRRAITKDQALSRIIVLKE